MNNNIAYLITKKHFEIEEVNFEELKKYTNNIILQYEKDFTKFKRALFELDRLGFNIGIYNHNYYSFIHTLKEIKGFNIKLGIWVEYHDGLVIKDLSTLDEVRKNYIMGLVHNEYNIPEMPKWGIMGDIENSEIIKLDFIKEPIQTLKLNTDFVKIYEENDLKPILSTYK